jgi:hypothetical protein
MLEAIMGKAIVDADASYQDTQSRSQRETLAQLGIVANGS